MRGLVKAISGGDEHRKELLSGSAISLLIKVFSAVLAFFMSVVLSRSLGAYEAGIFFLGVTLATLLASFSRMGLDITFVRYISAERSVGNFSGALELYRKGATWCAVLSIATGALLFLCADFFSGEYVFNQPGLKSVIFLMAAALPFMALYMLNAQALQGLKLVAKSSLVLSAIVPFCVILIFNIFNISSALGAAIVFFASCVVAFIISVFFWRTATAKFARGGVFANEKVLNSCLPLWGAMMMSQLVLWAAQLILGFLAGPQEVAFFSVAQRTANLAGFILVAVNSITAPKFSELYRSGDIAGMKRVSLLSVRLNLILGTPVVIAMMIFPEFILGAFGEDFKQASLALIVLSLGHFVNVMTGSVGFLLTMSGGERKLSFNMACAAFVAIGLGWVLIPLYGVVGGAVSTAVAMSLQNILGVIQVRKSLGFNTLVFWSKK